MIEKKVSVKIGDSELILSTGKMAKQANGAVMATYQGTSVLATACSGRENAEPLDYVPLQVEYNEKYYAAGKIPGGFLKREGRPKDKEILVSRLIDRPMRPLFDKDFGREIQIVPTVVSADQVNTPDMIAIIAASAAVTISDIPFSGPIAGVRVALVNDKYIINPTFAQIDNSSLDIVVAGTMDGITMVEGGAKIVSEEQMLKAIEEASKVIKELCKAQLELREIAGKEKIQYAANIRDLSYLDAFKAEVEKEFAKLNFIKGKQVRSKALSDKKKELKEKYASLLEENDKSNFDITTIFEEVEYELIRSSILKDNKRIDGRKNTDIRPISTEVGVLERTHGSALFTRGETQSLAITTLGTANDEQMLDSIDGDKSFSSFMLHYNFPPFSVGETGRLSTGRREIGHGHLAERALANIVPNKDEFPYTIRVVSEILESNGSSSMASVCAGTLSLMDAGVKIKKPVAGIAMGLITDKDEYRILSDILGEEDHFGDMDFKVAGTEDGITAFQMDIKIAGVSQELLKNALEQARIGRLHILSIMNKTLSSSRNEVNEYAPSILNLKIDVDKIGAVIGTGGKNIKAISAESSSEVVIDEEGMVTIYGKTKKMAELAKKLVLSVIEEPEVGKIYSGKVKRILDFGAFIEILPGKEGLCHISKLSKKRVKKVEDVLSLNQVVDVKLLEVDRAGRLNLALADMLKDDDEGSRSKNKDK